MASVGDIYAKLQVPEATPEDEICSCSGAPPIKLMSRRQVGGFNPIHCLDCNLEVPPQRLELSADIVEEIASWDWEHGALATLELASGSYETWAQSRLLDTESPTNIAGRALAGKLSAFRPCYAWFFQPQADPTWQPRTTCPVCGKSLEQYDAGIFPQLLCEHDRLVLVAS
jgi:hypothetical protein